MTRIGLLTAVAILSLATAASAHPQLKSAGPAPGSIVNVAPKALRIQFSKAVEAGFSGVELTNEKGVKQKTGKPTTAAKDRAQLIVPLIGAMAPGKYTVAWHAVGHDMHRVKGRYNFEVKP